MMKTHRYALVAAMVVLGSVAALAWTQSPPAPQGPDSGFADLVGGLKATRGCLGVQTAQTRSGQQVIFAWFEDKKAVLRWYYSDVHQNVQSTFPTHGEHRKPLESIPDDIGPIMAIASITMADTPQFEQIGLPISQIAIELYKPISGGLFLGGRFAPDGLKVDGMHDYTPPAKPKEERTQGPRD